MHTLETLDKIGFVHTGCRQTGETHSEAAYFELGKKIIAVISYTSTTNYSLNGNLLPDEAYPLVNCLYPQTRSLSSSKQKLAKNKKIF